MHACAPTLCLCVCVASLHLCLYACTCSCGRDFVVAVSLSPCVCDTWWCVPQQMTSFFLTSSLCPLGHPVQPLVPGAPSSTKAKLQDASRQGLCCSHSVQRDVGSRRREGAPCAPCSAAPQHRACPTYPAPRLSVQQHQYSCCLPLGLAVLSSEPRAPTCQESTPQLSGSLSLSLQL